ncbi:MAG: hypothetical protein NWS47_01235 [Alphaproteobacteria bacterium]|nr:hypothetical protein [Alphaproteobacteria bacterium]
MKFLKMNSIALAYLVFVNQSAQTMEFTSNSEEANPLPIASMTVQDETSFEADKEISTLKIGGKFEVRGKTIGEHTLRALADPTHQKYKRLSLHTCGIGSGKQKYSTVEVNESGTLLVHFLLNALLNQTEVGSLCLAGNVLNDEDITVLAPALKNLTNLTYLSFYMNRISDQGALTLANEVLPHLVNLRFLDLAANDVTDIGVASLAGWVNEMKF